MKLSKSDALFLHAILFHTLTESKGEPVDTAVRDLMNNVEDFLLGDDTDEEEEVDDELDEDVEDTEEEEEEVVEEAEPEAEATIDVNTLEELPSSMVVTPDGSKVSLEFESVNSHDSVDALLDGGGVVIDGITHLELSDDEVALYDGEEWHKFKFVKRVPKTWSRTLDKNVVYDVKVEV